MYTIAKKSSAAPKTKVSHKHSPSLATTSKSASTSISKKPKVDNSSPESNHLRLPVTPSQYKSSLSPTCETLGLQHKNPRWSQPRPLLLVVVFLMTTFLDKGKAVILDVSDSEANVKNIYDSTKIPACSVQGRKLTEKPEFMDWLMEYFSCAQMLQNTLNSPTSIAVYGGTLAPVRLFLQYVTMLPKICVPCL
uniref:Uncharacterized protein n=1 Tax=Moniliophthora roreri TaxID=221103 RepID=A0A0W0FIE2_MONRR